MLIIVRWGVALGMSQFILAAIMWGIEGLWQQQRSSLKPPFSITVLVQAETWKIIGSQNKWWICSCLQYGKFSSLFFSSFKLQKKDGRGRLKVNTVHTSLFVSFSVALDKNQTFTNNNVFHKLSRPTLPLQVVYKPWLIRISQGNKKLQHSSLCRIWFVHIWTSYITGRQDSHWTLCVSFGHTFDTIKYDFSILC